MGNNNYIHWCSNCLNTSTRPRIKFNSKGICNACLWSEEKKKIDWKKRKKSFLDLLRETRSKNSRFDCIVPVSGGKDGSYVVHKMKSEYNLNPLCVTIHPPLRTELGHKNLEKFKENNVFLTEINLPHNSLQKINYYSFILHGRPLYGWVIGLFAPILYIAKQFNINLIIYGEDGETEYGGSTNLKSKPFFDIEYIKSIYLSNEYNETIRKSQISKADLFWWAFPKNSENIKMTHWSYFENWDSYKNYMVAKKYFGYEENKVKNTGTYTNFSQNDTSLYDLHCYLMYLKFGFGRATQDIGIDIRRGALTRNQGIELARIYDHEFPDYALDDYLKYFKMTKNFFFSTLDKFVNKNLFKKKKTKWIPNFHIK